jgi:hypothetical protein
MKSPRFGGLVRATVAMSVIALAAATPAVSYNQDQGLNGIFSQLAGRKASVRCLTPKEARHDFYISFGAAAYVPFVQLKDKPIRAKGYGVFAPWVCENLIALERGDLSNQNAYDVAFSVLVITHEAGHVRGYFEEYAAECFALESLDKTLELFGIPSGTFAYDFLKRGALIAHSQLPEQYRYICH